MKSLPLPIRVAAGLAVTAVEQARTLPAKIAGLPVTVASQALQVSMRVQQQVTELAIRGDEVLASFRPVEDTPEWATFDEDVENGGFDGKPTSFESAFDRVEDEPVRRNGYYTGSTETLATPDPWTQEERAFAESGYGSDEPEDDRGDGGPGDGQPWAGAVGGDQSLAAVADDHRPSLGVAGADRSTSEGADEDWSLSGGSDEDRPLTEDGRDDRSLTEGGRDDGSLTEGGREDRSLSVVGGEDREPSAADGEGRSLPGGGGDDRPLSGSGDEDRSLSAGGEGRSLSGSGEEDQLLTGVGGESRSVAGAGGGDRPLFEVAGYDELSLPQLRARLRRFNADELGELLEYERAHGNRPSFVGMLTRRIAAVRDQR